MLRIELGSPDPQPAATARAAPPLTVSVGPWADPDPLLDRVGAWSGGALGLALLQRHARAAGPGEPAPLVLAVGDAVRRGLPTAARVAVLGRSPLTGALSEGQIGSELAPRLARLADAVVLAGRTDLPGALLVLAHDPGRDEPRVELRSVPELVGADPARTWQLVRDRIGPCALLRIGPGGERGLPFAGLSAGEEHTSFTGRGGLGAVFGALGLKALAITAEPEEGAGDAEAIELVRTLGRSPRLAARAQGGTLELLQARAAGGDLRARNYATALLPEDGARLADEARAASRERRGCRGCPTPCGWEFATGSGGLQRAHFGAAYALGPNLGLERFDDALELHALCDRAGLDAREVGAGLALLCLAEERGIPTGARWGDRAGLARLVDELVAGSGTGARLGAGAAELARELGLEDELHAAQGQAARPEADLAAVLGQCVTAGGNDPMRAFPFLTEAGGAGPAARLLAELEPPPGTADPADPAGKGRLVWWHENLMAAIDASGFCAFSAGGLLADGLLDLDQLAAAIAPRALRGEQGGDWAGAGPGRRLLAAGATLVLLRRDLDRRWGSAARSVPAWARAALERAGMLDEYRACRGLAPDGALRPESLAVAGTAAAGRPLTGWGGGESAGVAAPERGLAKSERGAQPSAPRDVSPAGGAQPAVRAGASGQEVRAEVVLRAMGPLRDRLGALCAVRVELPATVAAVLEEVASERPAARGLLLGPEGGLLPAVYRAGRRVGGGDPVETGDVLDLVLSISGG